MEFEQPKKRKKQENEISDETLVLGEFNEAEVEPCVLDGYGKVERTYKEWKHLFVNEDQFNFFMMLPGGEEVKAKILREAYENANK